MGWAKVIMVSAYTNQSLITMSSMHSVVSSIGSIVSVLGEGTLSQPDARIQADRTQVRAYLALPREYRKSILQSAFLDIMRIWLRVMAKPDYKSEVDGLTLDQVMSRALEHTKHEVDEVLNGDRTKLTQFGSIVVQRILDSQTSVIRPLDNETLTQFISILTDKLKGWDTKIH